MGYRFALFEVDCIQRAALPGPARGRTAERPKPSDGSGTVLYTDVFAQIEKLRPVPKADVSAFEKQDAEMLPGELLGQGDSGGPCAHDADVGVDHGVRIGLSGIDERHAHSPNG
jgi:hypothetical protein